jgi:hypothetical protein
MKFLIPIFCILCISCTSEIKYPEGGFEYPKNVADKDTNWFFYPIKDSIPKLDSIYQSYAYKYYQGYDEPNLSINTLQNETFRLTYLPARGKEFIITVTEKTITIKEGNFAIRRNEDSTHISSIEKLHYDILKLYFPIDDTTGKRPNTKEYLDSMSKRYPELLNADYFRNLYEKILIENNEKSNYVLTKISISKEQFNSLIQQINKSGYWALPYQLPCNDPPFDGHGYFFEANTKKKYNIVSRGSCDQNNQLDSACQKLIQLAGVGEQINLIPTRKIGVEDMPLENFKEKPIKKKHKR